jgi:hypothetical protein
MSTFFLSYTIYFIVTQIAIYIIIKINKPVPTGLSNTHTHT